jgi:hypothetical protein
MEIPDQLSQLRSPGEYDVAADLGLTAGDLFQISQRLAALATPKVVQHTHSTNRDPYRSASLLRRVKLFDPSVDVPNDILSLNRQMYAAVLVRQQDYLDEELEPWFDDHAAVVHVYYPGDGPGEGHCDYRVTAPVSLHAPVKGKGGELVIGKNQAAVGLKAIAADAWRKQPRSGVATLFDGRVSPHFVSKLNRGFSWKSRDPGDISKARIGVNYAFRSAVRPPDFDSAHPRAGN